MGKIKSKDRRVKKRKLYFLPPLLICLIIICLLVSLYFYFNPREVTIESEDTAIQYVEKINSLMLSGLRNDRIKKVLKYEIDESLILIGADSFQREKVSVNGDDLDYYEKQADILADNLEEKIKDNFEFEVTDVSETDGFYIVEVSYRSFYYFAYVSDVEVITTELLSMAGYSDDNGEISISEAEEYKAKVKAMQIIDGYLDTYFNEDESLTFNLYLTKGKSSLSENEVIAYLYGICGYNYQELSIYDAERLASYINEVDTDNVLGL